MNIDKLKSVIQAANPEIMELKFGCEVETREGEIVAILQSSRDGLMYEVARPRKLNNDLLITAIGKQSGFQILGRPIRLADVLLAIEKRHQGILQIINTLISDDIQAWNLKDDNLDNQSDESKQFLSDLLK